MTWSGRREAKPWIVEATTMQNMYTRSRAIKNTADTNTTVLLGDTMEKNVCKFIYGIEQARRLKKKSLLLYRDVAIFIILKA